MRLEPRDTRRRLIVMVTGAIPGLGKTSLCRRLVAHMNASSHPAALFAEQHILERTEFAEVIAAWRTREPVPPALLLDAVDRYVNTCMADETEVFVQDMLFPFLPSLLAWGRSDLEIKKFLAEFAERCKRVRLVQIHLTGDARMALQRAGKREGDGWLDQLMVQVSSFADHAATVDDLDGLARYYADADSRTQRLLSNSLWPSIHLDAALGEDEAAARANEWLVRACAR